MVGQSHAAWLSARGPWTSSSEGTLARWCAPSWAAACPASSQLQSPSGGATGAAHSGAAAPARPPQPSEGVCGRSHRGGWVGVGRSVVRGLVALRATCSGLLVYGTDRGFDWKMARFVWGEGAKKSTAIRHFSCRRRAEPPARLLTLSASKPPTCPLSACLSFERRSVRAFTGRDYPGCWTAVAPPAYVHRATGHAQAALLPTPELCTPLSGEVGVQVGIPIHGRPLP
jgi:hypothetical protein